MTLLDDGYGGYLLLLAIAVLVHEPWRWLGLILARNLTADSEFFIWVRAVATAVVAGLVMRLVLFPAGALDAVPLIWRLTALLGAIAIFFATRRNLGLGVVGGAALLVLATHLRGA